MCAGCQCSSSPRARNASRSSGVAAAVAEVPLARRDDLERAAAALVELHRVRDRLRLADELAGLGEQLDDARLRLLHGLARELRVRARRAVGTGGPPLGRSATSAAVAAEHVAHRQLQLAPPHDVGGVTERADHRDAGALLGIGERVRDAPEPARRTAACVTACPKRSGSARRRDARRARRTRGAARAASSRSGCRPRRRRRGT